MLFKLQSLCNFYLYLRIWKNFINLLIAFVNYFIIKCFSKNLINLYKFIYQLILFIFLPLIVLVQFQSTFFGYSGRPLCTKAADKNSYNSKYKQRRPPALFCWRRRIHLVYILTIHILLIFLRIWTYIQIFSWLWRQNWVLRLLNINLKKITARATGAAGTITTVAGF